MIENKLYPQGLLSAIRVRLLVREDLPALEWDGEYIHFRRLYADVYRRSEQGDALMWVAEVVEKGIIGQLFVSLYSSRPEISNGRSRAYIYGFRVRPSYRNQGVGTHMMQVVESDLSRRGYRLITLNVAQDNPGALRLYERLGYRVTGYEPGEWSYIDHQGLRRNVIEPAWRMEKKLSGRS
jgi:ribosomal protein S18 acetylase RimI-like enzyme